MLLLLRRRRIGCHFEYRTMVAASSLLSGDDRVARKRPARCCAGSGTGIGRDVLTSKAGRSFEGKPSCKWDGSWDTKCALARALGLTSQGRGPPPKHSAPAASDQPDDRCNSGHLLRLHRTVEIVGIGCFKLQSRNDNTHPRCRV